MRTAVGDHTPDGRPVPVPLRYRGTCSHDIACEVAFVVRRMAEQMTGEPIVVVGRETAATDSGTHSYRC